MFASAQGPEKRSLRWTGPLGRRVLRFDGLAGRGLWWRLRRGLKKGRGSAAGCVEGLQRFAQGATAPAALRVADCLSGNAYKVSVTDSPICVIWHDRHSADWLAALASPYPASPDFLLFRGQNKTPRNTFFISGSTVSTGCCAPLKRRKGGGARHQRGIAGVVHEAYDSPVFLFISLVSP